MANKRLPNLSAKTSLIKTSNYNWAGVGVGDKMKKQGSRISQGSDISSFPTRWYSPLLSFVNFYIPFDE